MSQNTLNKKLNEQLGKIVIPEEIEDICGTAIAMHKLISRSISDPVKKKEVRNRFTQFVFFFLQSLISED